MKTILPILRSIGIGALVAITAIGVYTVIWISLNQLLG